ncbi:hypothetical protein [Streptomyces sp. NBC_01171]|uniref:hypothetical protein n=1 Tax=Streptomyces sp. NBC_01171 TaxID=2903757 RepID=UPI00386D3005|nr:hypothetical protein OG448_14850 [Streptomyces sp. NBC_01171]
MIKHSVRFVTFCAVFLAAAAGVTLDSIDWPAPQPTHVAAAGAGEADGGIDWP